MSHKKSVIGLTFARLTIFAEAPSHFQPNGQRKRCVWVRCKCGKEFVTRLGHLYNGHTVSCGCRKVTHGRSQGDRTYRAWRGMIGRCRYAKFFRNYGSRGLKVCARWQHSFEAFLADMGECPPNGTLDRVDNNGHYEPGNCRWATQKQQMRNTRLNRMLFHRGEWRCASEWAEVLGMPKSTIFNRLARGIDPFAPLHKGVRL